MAEEYKKYRSTVVVNARKVDETESIVASGGIQVANPGDYILHTEFGYAVMDGIEFEESFREVQTTKKS